MISICDHRHEPGTLVKDESSNVGIVIGMSSTTTALPFMHICCAEEEVCLVQRVTHAGDTGTPCDPGAEKTMRLVKSGPMHAATRRGGDRRSRQVRLTSKRDQKCGEHERRGISESQ